MPGLRRTAASATRGREAAAGKSAAGRQRVALILTASKAVLVDGGYAEFTLRRVAGKAGLPLRHLQYYFRSKSDLLRALIEHICEDYINRCDQRLAMEQDDPKERFIACIDFLIDDNRDPVSNTIFFELWALACHDSQANELVDRLYTYYRAYIARLIRELSPGLSNDAVSRRALQIVALIEGLTLFIGRNKPQHAATRGLADDARVSILRIASET